MNELLLAITMLCTKTNDLNMYLISERKSCVVKILKCLDKERKGRIHLRNHIKCLEDSGSKGK